MARMARHYERPAGHIERLPASERPEECGFSHVLLLGMGDRASVRSNQDDLRHDQRVPRTSRARFNRSGSGEGFREQSRSEKHALHRLEQVWLDARANVFKQYFFDRIATSYRPEGSRPSLLAITDRARRCSRLPNATAFGASFSAGPTSGALLGSLRFRLVPRPSWAWMWRSSWTGPRMVCACMPSVPICRKSRRRARHDPRRGGAVGSREMTIVASPPILDLGAWLEQLVAESTGKEGKGLIQSIASRSASRCLWPRPPVCLSEIVDNQTWRRTRRGRTGTGRSPGGSHCDRRSVQISEGFCVGVRHRSR